MKKMIYIPAAPLSDIERWKSFHDKRPLRFSRKDLRDRHSTLTNKNDKERCIRLIVSTHKYWRQEAIKFLESLKDDAAVILASKEITDYHYYTESLMADAAKEIKRIRRMSNREINQDFKNNDFDLNGRYFDGTYSLG